MTQRGDAIPDATRRRTTRRLLAPIGAFVLVVVIAVAIGLSSGETDLAELVLSGGIGLIALWALVDALFRAFGRPTYLGTGRGLDRLLGVLQAVIAVAAAFALLPNVVSLLNYLATLGRTGSTP